MLIVTAAESFRKNEFVLAFDDLFSSFILVDDLESRLRVLSTYNLRILFPWTSFSCFEKNSFHSLLLRLVSLSNLMMAPANSVKRDSNGHEIRRALRSTSAGIRKPHRRGSSKLQLRLLKKFTMILRFAFQNIRLCINDDAASSQGANDAGHHSVDRIPLLMTSNAQDLNSAFIRNLNERNAASKSEYSGRYLTASQEEVLPFD